jgi:hypothetical protein
MTPAVLQWGGEHGGDGPCKLGGGEFPWWSLSEDVSETASGGPATDGGDVGGKAGGAKAGGRRPMLHALCQAV